MTTSTRYWLIIWGEEFFKFKKKKKYSFGIYIGKIHERYHDGTVLGDNYEDDLLPRFIVCRSLPVRVFNRKEEWRLSTQSFISTSPLSGGPRGEGRSPARHRIGANFGVRSGHELHPDIHWDILVFMPFQE